jgi:Trp operon repressor
MSAFVEMIQKCKSKEEIENLITDLFTDSEKLMIEERFHIMFHLNNGLTQRDVKDKLNISIATVTRGAKVLNFGSGVIKKLLQRSTYFSNHHFTK